MTPGCGFSYHKDNIVGKMSGHYFVSIGECAFFPKEVFEYFILAVHIDYTFGKSKRRKKKCFTTGPEYVVCGYSKSSCYDKRINYHHGRFRVPPFQGV